MKEEKEIEEKLIQIFLDEIKSEKRIPKGVDVKLLHKALSKNIQSVDELKKLLS